MYILKVVEPGHDGTMLGGYDHTRLRVLRQGGHLASQTIILKESHLLPNPWRDIILWSTQRG